MTTNADVFQAGVDAVIADNTLNKNGFEAACRTIATRINNAEADAWVTALIVEYERLGIINNPTYGSFRSEIINEGQITSLALFEALGATVNALPETSPVNDDVQKTDLIAERDEVNISIDTLVTFKQSGQTRQVRDAVQLGIDQLRGYKESVRDQLKTLG